MSFNHIKVFSIVFCLGLLFQLNSAQNDSVWGFFGHRLINKQAVYSLPGALLFHFKRHQTYLTEHAIDADKRRYAAKEEAVKHYMDAESWGDVMEDTSGVPMSRLILQKWKVIKVCDVDTQLIANYGTEKWTSWENQFNPFRCTDWITIDTSYEELDEGCEVGFYLKEASHGMLPIALLAKFHQLVRAFEAKDWDRILRHAADLGHYIGDAHVPLHTTENYNGQLTNQLGIHAFWETRIPELFALDEFGFYVGKAEYLPNIEEAIDGIIRSSNALVSDVLLAERETKEAFNEDKVFCPTDRGGQGQYQQCEAFSRAYKDRMNGMVERQMQKAIINTANFWWTAYVNAGQPLLLQDQLNDSMKDSLVSAAGSLQSTKSRECQ